MLRHPHSSLRALAVGVVVAALAGCGIKGPLTPPPKPEAQAAESPPAKGAAKPVPRL